MATLNDYGDDPQGYEVEGLGDVAYDKIEDKAKEKAEDVAKDAAKKAGHAADKLTDKVGPVKQAKDFVKNKVSAVQNLKNKAKKGAKDMAKKGAKAAAKTVKKGVQTLGKLMLAHPLISIIAIIAIIGIMSLMDNIEFDDTIGGQESDDMMLENPVYVEIEDIDDNETVVVLMSDCVTPTSDALGQMDAEKEAQAGMIYSIFHEKGFTNTSIAGILACFDKESGFDPSAIEGILSEYGFLGSRKAEALLDLNNYTEHTLFPMYVNNGTSINKSAYEAVDEEGHTKYYCGLGLPQFTGPAAYDLLRAAKTLEKDWYDMNFQLAYIASDSFYRPNTFADWVGSQEEPADDTEEAMIEAARASAKYFALKYEGVPASRDDMLEERMDIAEEWIKVIKDWGDENVDQELVDSITALAGELGSIIEFVDMEKVYYRCLNNNPFDNSTMANAAISFAWPTKDQSRNDGTNLYRAVHDGIWNDNANYKDCGYCVSSAAKWSGTDITLEPGTSNMVTYLAGSAKWEFVGSADSVSVDDLMPGDIFIIPGHVFMYVSSELVQTAYPEDAEAGSDSVSASKDTRSAACGNDASDIINRMGGQDWENRGIYQIYRCVSPDNSDTYKHLGYELSETTE